MRVVQCFFDVNMQNGHDGLQLIAKKGGVDVRLLGQGEFVVFINRDRNRIKLYATNNTTAYYKRPRGASPLSLESIPNIVKAFGQSGKIDYDRALKQTIEKKLGLR